MEENKNLMVNEVEEVELEGLAVVVQEQADNQEFDEPEGSKAVEYIVGTIITGVAIGLGTIAYRKYVKPAKEKLTDKLIDKAIDMKMKRDAKKQQEAEAGMDTDGDVVEVESE